MLEHLAVLPLCAPCEECLDVVPEDAAFHLSVLSKSSEESPNQHLSWLRTFRFCSTACRTRWWGSGDACDFETPKHPDNVENVACWCTGASGVLCLGRDVDLVEERGTVFTFARSDGAQRQVVDYAAFVTAEGLKYRDACRRHFDLPVDSITRDCPACHGRRVVGLSPNYYWSAPERPEWRNAWGVDGTIWDERFTVTVFAWNPGELHYTLVREGEAWRYTIKREHIWLQRRCANPETMNAWWKTPITDDAQAATTRAWRELRMEV